jgi:hypothetical protein
MRAIVTAIVSVLICYCAQVFMTLFFLMMVAQCLLVYWKKKHYRSYQQECPEPLTHATAKPAK